MLGFTASSSAIGRAPDVFVLSENEWNFFFNQKVGKHINVNKKIIIYWWKYVHNYWLTAWRTNLVQEKRK